MPSRAASSAKLPKCTPRRALIAQILFQLDQLSATNSHHEFEHICRHLARETITSNILPATGPVSAGGDDGRDFETFTTFIRRREVRTSLFRGRGESEPLVFACSITDKSRIKAKVRDDLAKICARESPRIIYFFSNQNIPVAARKELQSECAGRHKCKLEILDAQAIAEQFADPALFWLAEEYLHIPNELFPEPRVAPKSAYATARARWLDDERTPRTFADFVGIKYGLRAATFNDEFKLDLKRWIALMERFLVPDQNDSLTRRATYEICVATLRGLHDLRPRRALVQDFLADWQRWTKTAEIRDTALLLSYASSAVLHREFDIEAEILHRYSVAIVKFVDSEIVAASDNPNRKADLVYTRSSLASLPFLRSITPQFDLGQQVKFWFKLLAIADKAPLFELESFVDNLSQLTPMFSEHPDFNRLLRRADDVLEKRTSGFVVAEKCCDRAFALMDQGKVLASIAELHRAKVKWFTGDTLRPTLLAMLALCTAYRKLGLLWAAKYYAFAVAFLIHRTSDDDLKPLFVSALHEVAACNYAAGEWVSLSELLPIILSVHYEFLVDPDNWEVHEQLLATISHFFVARAVAKALNGDPATAVLNEPLAATKMPADLEQDLLRPEIDQSRFETLTIQQVRSEVQQEFFGVPLCDTGALRVYTWSALGIEWRVTCDNKYETIQNVEQLVAILQITLADLAFRDLCLLPTKVALQVELAAVSGAKFETIPGNYAASMKVTLPNSSATDPLTVKSIQRDVCKIALAALTHCSCLPDKDLVRTFESAFRDGLTSKLFIVRPYSELFAQFIDPTSFNSRRTVWLGPPDADAYEIRTASELAWLDTPGPGYSAKKAKQAISNRYKLAIRPIARTLARLQSRPHFQEWVANHRAGGRQDWWILMVLMNTVINYRATLLTGGRSPQALRDYITLAMAEDEAVDAPAFPEELLFSEDMKMAASAFILSTARVWDIVVRTQTPDLEALERLLNIRYGQSKDDVEHTDPFVPFLDGTFPK